MQLPDQSHINQVRQALWQRHGNASVMIGAGFSRNAVRTSPQSKEMPTWHEVAQKLCSNLYPATEPSRLENAIREASGTSGFLRLAQEYESAFGRAAIHSFVKDCVPDLDYSPDELHARLLRLPWRDVFTTNWDTLLERTRPKAPQQSYSVVLTPEELSSTAQPRIIKLHGSLPSQTPFIFTEEDYRTYPRLFSPFVNTVQQAMMETTFILIGFSGDDPNFLQWTGWVRDNLGSSTPKIYLAGWLDLSPHRRRMLEKRDVVPIDVSKHPNASKWPISQRHKYATEWIIATLENGRPYDISEWPGPKKEHSHSIPAHLIPVETLDPNSPIKEPSSPNIEFRESDSTAAIESTVSIWRHNRELYPGWLFTPLHKKHLMSDLWEWQRWIIPKLETTDFNLALRISRELVWKHKTLLNPISIELRTALEDLLSKVNLDLRKINNESVSNYEWGNILLNAIEISEAITTSYRYDIDEVNFFKWIEKLKKYDSDDLEKRHFIKYEICLWSLINFDHKTLTENLDAWDLGACDPAWMMRKAKLYASLGLTKEAKQLVSLSLQAVRNDPNVDQSLSSPSREGWLLWLTVGIEERYGSITSYQKRWQELTPLECNARMQKTELLNALIEHQNNEAPLFNLGARKGETYSFSDSSFRLLVDAYRAIRLTEIAGLPPTYQNWSISKDILTIASEKIAKFEPKLAMRISIDVAGSERDHTFNRIWTRTRIAQRPQPEIIELGLRLKSAIDFTLKQRQSSQSSIWRTRLEMYIEGLSRLTLRFNPEQASENFELAMNLYKNKQIVDSPTLTTPLENLITRSWDTLSLGKKKELFLEILRAPIIGLDGIVPRHAHYIEPALIIEQDLIYRDNTKASEWDEVLHLIQRGLTSKGIGRKNAALRLYKLTEANVLTEEEKFRLANLLWLEQDKQEVQLPKETGLIDWTFLILPEPEPNIAATAFKKKWLHLETSASIKEINEHLYNLGLALENLKSFKKELNLSKEEEALVFKILELWTQNSSDNDYSFDKSGFTEGAYSIAYILRYLNPPSQIADLLFESTDKLAKENLFCRRILGGLTKSLNQRHELIARELRIALSDNNQKASEDAIIGLQEWLKRIIRDPLEDSATILDLVREIGIIIASRRPHLLYNSLTIATRIFESGTDEQRNIILDSVTYGLRHLLGELDYSNSEIEAIKWDVPLLRWGCINLAIALKNAGYSEDDSVIKWIEAAKKDPLPEVRQRVDVKI